MNTTSQDVSSLLAALKREGLDTVYGAFAHKGGQELVKKGLGHRSRTRLSITDDAGQKHELYMKRYGPDPLVARLRRWFTYGWGCSAGGIEVENIRAARRAGVGTMREVIFGEEPNKPGPPRSYLVVTAVPGDALERCFRQFQQDHAADVEAFTRDLADLVRRLHDAGYVHRDLYASHVFLDCLADRVQLHLIDLARMFRPRWRAFRWRAKDLAQLKHSMPGDWIDNYWDAFMRQYIQQRGQRLWWRYSRAIDRKVASMRRRTKRKVRSREEGEASE